ncbi:MAG: hypothetical protein ABI992_10005 [Chthoniobacterales bacterium]
MSFISPAQVDDLLPLACAWAEEQERAILAAGLALDESQSADARRVGVLFPERIRLLRVDDIPFPTDPILAAAAAAAGFISSATVGLTLRYGIFIRTAFWGQRRLVVHECAHTMQYERLGGFREFLRPYFLEFITPPGYPHGPLEQEARRLQIEACS